jgi:hypothetical protein
VAAVAGISGTGSHLGGVRQADVDAEDVGVTGERHPDTAHRDVGNPADPAVRLAQLLGDQRDVTVPAGQDDAGGLFLARRGDVLS